MTLKLNNRKILSGIAEAIGEADKFVAITVAIDKIDKIGLEKVEEELRANGLSDNAPNIIKRAETITFFVFITIIFCKYNPSLSKNKPIAII